ncbi:hypothetical protein AAFF_G00294130 [Aldrovandia affinis]|uniref:Uncharacterized protein n=1 Tax=Aldrovandia affinis TaxID=143900 RepID=A0AAD7W1E9_9TELE|nr:hypothetical protein AAFF_G00294130 [Aldrovandia affinis]
MGGHGGAPSHLNRAGSGDRMVNRGWAGGHTPELGAAPFQALSDARPISVERVRHAAVRSRVPRLAETAEEREEQEPSCHALQSGDLFLFSRPAAQAGH